MIREQTGRPFKGLEVTPREGESPERMIKRFMRKVRDDGILNEVFIRSAFEKPSDRRRRKRLRSLSRVQREKN